MDFNNVLASMWSTEVGTIWRAPNRIWKNGFAQNKSGDSWHPAVVERVKKDNITVRLAPGTSKQQSGLCVFRVRFNLFSRKSYFLLKLAMPYLKDDLMAMQRGWNDTMKLEEDQIKNLRLQCVKCDEKRKSGVNNFRHENK